MTPDELKIANLEMLIQQLETKIEVLSKQNSRYVEQMSAQEHMIRHLSGELENQKVKNIEDSLSRL